MTVEQEKRMRSIAEFRRACEHHGIDHAKHSDDEIEEQINKYLDSVRRVAADLGAAVSSRMGEGQDVRRASR